ncbi:hypothetical protein JR334_02040 [Clostridia bacterium]|nr:hypothetical protein JR334_02040 [Clostridia bacterium]
MAKKIQGLTLELGGEMTTLTKALAGVNKHSRDLATELKQVDRLLKLDPTNTELVAQKQKILAESVDTTQEKLKGLKEAEKQVQAQFKRGEVTEEQYRDLKREIVKTEAQVKSLNTSIQKTSTKTVDLAKNLKTAGDSLKNVGSTMSTKVTAPIVAGVTAAVVGTQDLREDLAKLETNADQAGISAEKMEDQFVRLGAVSEDSDSNIEALSNLLATGFSEEGITSAVDALSGAVIKFPDTLKIEGLADGLQETLATGSAVGSFSELLERSGVNLDTFNEGLVAAQEAGKAENYILQELANTGLAEVNEAYRTANEGLVESKEGSKEFELTIAELGETLQPIVTAVTEAVTGLLQEFNALSPTGKKTVLIIGGIVAAIGPLLMVIGSIMTGIAALTPVFAAVGTAAGVVGGAIGAISLPVVAVVAAIAGLIALGVGLYKNWDKVKEVAGVVFESVKNGIGNAVEAIQSFFSGLIEKGQNLVTSFKELGKNIIQGLIDGITGMIGKVKEKIGEVAENIKGSFKKLLGINSPSTVFAGFGENTGAGFIEGIKSTKRDIDKATSSMINLDGMQTSLSGGSLAFAGGGTSRVDHSGTIRVEGVNDQGQLMGAVEVVVDRIKNDLARQQRRSK